MTELSPGDVFVNHRIEGLAGRGGMGVVYRATQLGLDRLVALKVIAPALADDPEFRERFVAESKAAASIEHPNVIPVYYAGDRDGVLFIVMRYVDGPDLRALVRANGPLEPDRTAGIISQVGAALDAAHVRGLVHRDVKPANVLLGPNDHAYLTDFGLTKSVTATSGPSRTRGWVGTLGFVSPEQIRGDRVDARSDVYALGCVLVYALAGRAPFVRDNDEATMWAHLNAPPPDDAVPPAFAHVVARALAKDPSDRYPSAGDLGRAALAAAGRLADSEVASERVVARGAAAPAGSDRALSTPVPAEEGETRPSPGWEEPAPAGPRPAVTYPTAYAGAAPAPRAPAGAADPGGAPSAHEQSRVPRGRLAALAAVLAVVAAVALVALAGGSDDAEAPDRPAATEPRGPRAPIAGEPVAVGARPNALTIAGGRVWAVSSSSSDITLVDARTAQRVDRVDVGEGGTSIAAGFDSVWVVKGSTQTLLRIDARTGRRQGPAIQLPQDGRAVAVAAGEGAVWVGVRSRRGRERGPERVVKIAPRSGAQQVIQVEGGVQDLTVGEGAVWVSNRFRDSVVRIGAASGRQVEVPVAAGPQGLAVGEGAVWVAAEQDDVLTRINASSRRRVDIRLEDTPARVAVGGGSVWVTARAANELLRIDPRTREVVADVDMGRRPFAVDVGGGDAVWVSLLGEDAVQRVAFGGAD